MIKYKLSNQGGIGWQSLPVNTADDNILNPGMAETVGGRNRPVDSPLLSSVTAGDGLLLLVAWVGERDFSGVHVAANVIQAPINFDLADSGVLAIEDLGDFLQSGTPRDMMLADCI